MAWRSIRRFDERAVNLISTRPVAAVPRARAVEEGAPGRRVAVRGRVPVPEVVLVVVQAHEPVQRVPEDRDVEHARAGPRCGAEQVRVEWPELLVSNEQRPPLDADAPRDSLERGEHARPGRLAMVQEVRDPEVRRRGFCGRARAQRRSVARPGAGLAPRVGGALFEARGRDCAPVTGIPSLRGRAHKRGGRQDEKKWRHLPAVPGVALLVFPFERFSAYAASPSRGRDGKYD